MDIKTPEARSKNMAAIKCRNTKPELILRKALFRSNLRYRINTKLPGKPDIVFPGKKIAVFVDGCFWHCCPKCFKQPKTNSFFWEEKISANIIRDEAVNEILKSRGWTVERFWEHEINKNLSSVVKKIIKLVRECN